MTKKKLDNDALTKSKAKKTIKPKKLKNVQILPTKILKRDAVFPTDHMMHMKSLSVMFSGHWCHVLLVCFVQYKFEKKKSKHKWTHVIQICVVRSQL